MNEQVAFLSLARRLGNPIADQPETIAAIEDYDLVRAFRALPPRHRRVVRLTLDYLARWHRPKDPQRQLMTRGGAKDQGRFIPDLLIPFLASRLLYRLMFAISQRTALRTRV